MQRTLHNADRAGTVGGVRPLRLQELSAIYHVTTNGVDDAPIYIDDRDRSLWLRALGIAVARFELEVFQWCQMTTHFHLLGRAPKLNLDSAMHWLNGVYAQGFNKRHDRRGHLFGDRYSSWLIRDEDHLRRTVRYIALNPVEAGICEWPAEWEWSSYTTTVAGVHLATANTDAELLAFFGPRHAARANLRAYVEAGLPLERVA